MNDTKCKEISKNAKIIYDKIMNKDFIMDYMKNILNNISYKYSLQTGGNVSDNYKQYKENRKQIVSKELIIEDVKENRKSKIAIIVPYRNNKYQARDKQLALFIEYYHSFIPNMDIFVIEQSDDGKKFNKGAILNIAFKIITKNHKYDMYIFHDVDLISPPEFKNIYSYVSDIPIHIASLWKEKYKFGEFFGGIISYNEKIYNKTI